MIAGQLLLILLCMVAEAFFAGMETGVISIHRMRLRHFIRKGAPGASILQGFVEDPDRLLGTTLVGTNICVVVISVIAASLAVRLIGSGGEAVSSVLVTLLVLVFCEYLPKAWFHSRPLERCRRFAGLLRSAEIVFRPFSATIIWLTRWIVPGAAQPFGHPLPFVTREDLKILAHEGEKDGVLSPRERFMIHRVFELSGKTARQIMIPRNEMTYVETDTTIDEFFDLARRTNYTRMPVYDDNSDRFVGVVNVFHVLSNPPDDRSRTVAQFCRPPLFISESMPVDDIFPRLRRSRQPMCFVTDDDGQVIGLITTEDILEEIVGKL